MSFQFQDFSIFWIIICVLLGVGYAFLLYRKEQKLSKKIRNTLAIVRGVTVFLLSIFLFSPLITRKELNYEKPIVLVAQDNSQSILLNNQKSFYQGDYLVQRKKFIEKLSDKFEVKDISVGGELTENGTIDFSDRRSNLSLVLQEMINAYRNRNLAAVVLASDGLHNAGPEPQSYIKQVQSPIYTMLMGDSIPKRDLRISNIIHNEIVYKKNDFMVEIRLNAFDLKDKIAKLHIEHKGKTEWSNADKIVSENQQLTFKAVLNATEPGMQKYIVKADLIPGEKNLRNNVMEFYIEVLENRQQIALIAAAPHPDLAALKSSIESNENYQVDLILADEFNLSQLPKYQLLILHQVPSSFANMSALFSQIEKQNFPTWVILGNQSYLDLFNRYNYGLKVLNSRSSANEVLPIDKGEFQGFVLSSEWSEFLKEVPPLYAPFGNYRASNVMQTLFAQKIGSVITDQPLLSFGVDGERKYAILAAEGLWKWRMENLKWKGNSVLFDELSSKIVQYLSSKDDKRKFRVNLPRYKFEHGENVYFMGELYNDSYELINTPDVKIIITDEQKKNYDLLFSKTEKSYELEVADLPAGEYSYKAETMLGNKKYEVKGQFTIVKNNLEEMNTTADYTSLRILSKLSGARAFGANEYDALAEELLKDDRYKTVSYEENKTDEWISLKWIFFLFISLLTFEWVMRKYNGTY